MKIIFTLTFVLLATLAFPQWTRVGQVPASDVYTVYKKDSTLYAGGSNRVYFSKDKGQTWDSSAVIPSSAVVNAIIWFKDELYVGTFNGSVYKSHDPRIAWQNIGAGILPDVNEFCIWRGNLYAATLGGGMFRLDSVGRNSWASFNDGLSSLSININTLTATGHAMIAGTLSNGLYDRYSDGSTQWNEQFILNQLNPNETFFDVVTAHDSLFMAGNGDFCFSTDEGISWVRIGSPLPTLFTNLANTRQALLTARTWLNNNGGTINTTFYYLKKNSLHTEFTPFSDVTSHLSYKMAVFNDKLWDASSTGLYYMSMSNLPGITSADDEDTVADSGPTTDTPPVPDNNSFAVGKVYPNPVAGAGNITVNLTTARHLSASIYDAAGRLVSVLADHKQLNAGSTILSFNMSDLHNGIYFLKLSVNNEVFVREIVHTL